MNWQKCSVCSNQNKLVGGKAGNVISKLCTGQATKNGLVNCSAEPLGAHCDEEMANQDIQKRSVFGHIQTQKYENEQEKI